MRNSQVLAAELSSPFAGSLRKSAVRGAVWTTAQSVVNRLSGVVVFLVLARLLAPREFGLLAAAQVFIALGNTFADIGLTRTLVQRPVLRAAHLDAALLMSSAAGVVLGTVLAVTAPWVADLYGMPDLKWVLVGLSIIPLLYGVSSVPESILQRQLNFRSLALRGSSSIVASAIIGIALAFAGAGVWALVAQAASQAVIAAAVLWVRVGWRPSARWDADAVRELLGFGSHVMGIQLLNFINRQSAPLLVGVVLGPVALGLYAVAGRVVTLVRDLLVSNVLRVGLPVFSRVSEQPARLAAAYQRATEVTTLAAFPCFALMGALGPDLTPILFGRQWTSAGPLMSILALAGAVQSIALFNISMMLATNHSLLALRWTAAIAVTNLAVFATTVQFGVTVLAAGLSARECLMLPIGLYLVRRVSVVGLRQQLTTLLIPSVGCAVLGVAVLACRWAYNGETATWGYLLTAASAGSIVYLGTVGLLRPGVASSSFRWLLRRRRTAHAGASDSQSRPLVP